VWGGGGGSPSRDKGSNFKGRGGRVYIFEGRKRRGLLVRGGVVSNRKHLTWAGRKFSRWGGLGKKGGGKKSVTVKLPEIASEGKRDGIS